MFIKWQNDTLETFFVSYVTIYYEDGKNKKHQTINQIHNPSIFLVNIYSHIF